MNKRRVGVSDRFRTAMRAIDTAMPFFCCRARENELRMLLGDPPADAVRGIAFNLFVQEPRARVERFDDLVQSFIRNGVPFQRRDVPAEDSVVAAIHLKDRDTLDRVIALVHGWATDPYAEPDPVLDTTHARWTAEALLVAVRARLTLLPRHIADAAFDRWTRRALRAQQGSAHERA